MFVGHFAVALAGKRVAPRVSLGTLFFAAQFLDLLWPILVLVGVEHVRIDPGNTAVTPLDFYDYPVSHSLLTAIMWGAVIAGLYFLARRRTRAAALVGIVVVSHWALDVLTHRPDMPLSPWSTAKVGLGLWYSLPATMLVEGGMFVAAIIAYVKVVPATDRIGGWTFWALMILLGVFWITAMIGPPPPDTHALAYSGLVLWVFVPWGYWIDRHRAQASVNS